ncbi:Protein CBG25692 [Caenorhabditis briggsae]|uniref:Protein CBG25692 n=1 Tax=Caenorhabditis briggsae TaxID=6238 RepID=B6IKP8_CAEBR|nr:Protein CBG25692 [Caenorhabditis briggsae]CAS00478.1 Protein CBG25692 [Caenorhabditis briggsae]
MKDAVETLEDIIDLADEVEKAKKDKVMDDLVKFWKDSVEYAKELKKVDKAMKKFAKEVEESEPDWKMFRQLDYMEPLLEKSIAGIEDLAGLNQVHELRNEVETIIKSEKTVTEVIKYVKGPTEIIILDVVFKDFRKSAKNLTLITMQDARLPMNAMDSKGQTGLYKAVLAKKWYRVKDLLENGALVDATCGPYLRTALFELVLMKDKEHAKDFLDAGAYILQPDVAGYYPEQYADEGGFMLLFDGYSKENQRKRVIPPNTPRPYKILVVDKDYIPSNERKNLPKRIRKKITWGYNESMDLNKFTHIVVPQKYSKKENILTLEDDDLFIWKSWKTETEKYSLAPFRFVLECIARYQILPIGSTVIQMNEENGADGVEGTKSKEAVNVPTTPTNVEPTP